MRNIIGVLLIAIAAKLASFGMSLVTDKAVQGKLIEGFREGFREL